MDYADNRKKHLSDYAGCQKDVMGGRHKGKGEYDHIINIKTNIDKNDQYKKVVQYNLLNGVSPDMLKKEKLHTMAHYLTSSQILCYNFFRPLLDANAHPTAEFIALLQQKGICLSSKAVGEFEYSPQEFGRDKRLEHTEFDFHLIDNTTGAEVFFEIKYTENGFGKWDRYATTDNYNNFYVDMFESCYALEKTCPDLKYFSEHFQLYRNALRVKRSNQYSVFIFPDENSKVKEEFEEFRHNIVHEENVLAWTWEELTKDTHETEFYRKYFSK